MGTYREDFDSRQDLVVDGEILLGRGTVIDYFEATRENIHAKKGNSTVRSVPYFQSILQREARKCQDEANKRTKKGEMRGGQEGAEDFARLTRGSHILRRYLQ